MLKKSRGFTLIELMLVLALVVALTAAGIAAYQIQVRNFKIDKTALQMQQWLQAGLAFYADCKQWPTISDYNDRDNTNLAMIIGRTEMSPDFCKAHVGEYRAYMPAGSQWGVWTSAMPLVNIRNYYTVGPYLVSGQDSLKDPPAFQVETLLRYTPYMYNIGHSIAARLPNGNAEHIGNIVKITAYVSAGAQNGGNIPNGNGGFIVDMEMVPPGQTAKHIKMPDASICGNNLKPVLVSSIAGIDGGYYDKNLGRVGIWQLYLQNSKNRTGINSQTGFIDEIDTDQATGKIKPNFKVSGDQGGANIGNPQPGVQNQLLFISACLPDPNKKAKKALPKDINISQADVRF